MQIFRNGNFKSLRFRRHLQIQQRLQCMDGLLLFLRREGICAVLFRRAVFVKDFLPLLGEKVRFLLELRDVLFQLIGQPQTEIPARYLRKRRDCLDDLSHLYFHEMFLLIRSSRISSARKSG